ncbi:MAG TPA: hypothetical protein VJU87_03330 [Gemmatimonadaceae bacterium]|nr:hypothetical protein [Gemmatimonadaceae bacterium]
MRRSLQTLAIAAAMSAAAAILPAPASAQATPLNDGILIGTVDAAALGLAPQPVFGLYATSRSNYLTSLAFGAGPGTLRLISSVDQWIRSSFGVGYAVGLGTRAIPYVGTFTLGTDAELGYTSRLVAQSNWAVGSRLAMPIGLRWGREGLFSVAPYVMPYVELGSQTLFEGIPAGCSYLPSQYSCSDVHSLGQHLTRSAGMGVGLHVTLWRLTVEGAYRDTRYPGRQLGGATVGASLSFREP